jgi:predicted permease
MGALRAWFMRLWEPVYKQRRDLELAAEMESHLQMHIEDSIRAGVAPEEARRQALIALGGIEQTKENYRDRRGFPVLEAVIQDLRFGLHMLRKSPGFTAVAVLTLALGIGANTAVFSVVQGVLLRPLPYKNPESLVEVWNTYLPTLPQIGLSGADFENWRQQAHSLSEMAGYRFVGQGFNVTGEGEPDRFEAAYATSNLFALLGVRPVAGRTFGPTEDKPASAPVVVISHRVWQSRFGSDPSVVGRTLNLDGKSYTLIGVLPASFHLLPWADLWLPVGQMDPDELTGRVFHPFGVIARLKPGAGISQSQAELATLANQAALEFPATNQNFGVIVNRIEDSSAAKMRRALLLLFAAVGLVLLIASANVVNLLLSRSATRQKEIALRAAMGASQSRLVRQLLTESLLLSFVGGALGLFLAVAGLEMLGPLLPSGLANAKYVGLNGCVLGFTITVCFLAGIACGFSPALQYLRTDLNHFLNEGGRGSSAFGGHKLQRSLVVSEIALALMPLIGAGLLLSSFHHLVGVNPGFRPDHLLTMQVPQAAIPASALRQMSTDQRQQLFHKQSLQFEQIADRIENLPGVERVGGIDALPLASSTLHRSRFVIEGQPIPAAGGRPSAEVRTISVGYFSALGIPLIAGRLFNEDDWAFPRVVINDAMARRFWPGGDPIGKRINLCSLAPQPCWSSIIGVVGDLHQFGLDAAPTYDVYGTGGWTPYFVVRTASEPLGLAAAAVKEVHKSNPALPVSSIVTMEELLSDSVSPRHFSTLLLSIFAGLALVLSAVGIYSVMAYAVTQRTHEIGIRMALGAQRRDIWSPIVWQGTRLAFSGVAIGLAGALALTRLLSTWLYGVTATDPVTFAGVAMLLMIVALAACYIPARRAIRVDPAVALRHE